MFWSVLGRILWARRAIVFITTACCLAGGAYIVLTVPPSYDATARVLLNNITRPDPVYGMVVSTRTVDAYVKTQIGTIRDVQVVAPALEAIGWFDDPTMIAAYSARPSNDQRDYATWLAQRIIPSLQAYPVEDSNMLEIRFRAPSPDLAKLVVGAVRDAYISTSVSDRRAGAEYDADQQQKRAEGFKVELAALEARQAEAARKTGILMQPSGVDMDSRRLSQLAAPSRAPADFASPEASQSKAALLAIDGEISQAETSLGPNHPRVVQLRRARSVLEQAAKQEAEGTGAAQAAVIARERAVAGALSAQTQKVLGQRKDLVEIRLLQDQVEAKARAYTDAVKRAASARQMASTIESGLTATGDVAALPDPAFPNKPLILGGTGGFGLLAGILIALLTELLDLRVRTRSGVVSATNVPFLGSVPSLASGGGKRRWKLPRFGLRRLRPAAA